jgi:hypothetical protein
VVNVLPKRNSLLEHLGDVQGHRCLVSGDSLPMHLALGTRTRCVTLFTCTSPWEICDYGLQTKIVSPLLEEFFYKRDFDARATTAIGLDEVREAVTRQYLTGLDGSGNVAHGTPLESPLTNTHRGRASHKATLATLVQDRQIRINQ